MSIEPAVPRPLRWLEIPISFSRDDEWTSFSKPGKFALVLDPVVAEVRLTRVLIDDGSGLNLIFTSTLRKMGLYLTDMLVPSKFPFYGIVPGNAVHPLRVHQIQSCQLRIFLSCHTGQTGTGQIHGSAALRLFASQDARMKWGTHSPRRLEEVV
jgi:hypothetical protein